MRVILGGGQTPVTAEHMSNTMPGYAWTLTDQQVAELTNSLRANWGNHATAVTAEDVAKARKAEINHQTLSHWVPLLCISASLLLGGLAVYHAKRQITPLIDLWALRIKSYSVTIWSGSLYRIAIGAVPFLLPLLFQIGFGMSAFHAGLLVLAVFAGNLMMKPFTSAILYRFRFRSTLLVNGLLNAVTIFSCALITPETPYVLIILLLFVSGLTRSMQFTALNTLAYSEIPASKMGGANTFSNMIQQLAMGLGIAIGALALRIAEWFHPYRAGMIPLENFQIAFVVIGVVALLSIVDTLTLNRDAGDEVRKRPSRLK